MELIRDELEKLMVEIKAQRLGWVSLRGQHLVQRVVVSPPRGYTEDSHRIGEVVSDVLKGEPDLFDRVTYVRAKEYGYVLGLTSTDDAQMITGHLRSVLVGYRVHGPRAETPKMYLYVSVAVFRGCLSLSDALFRSGGLIPDDETYFVNSVVKGSRVKIIFSVSSRNRKKIMMEDGAVNFLGKIVSVYDHLQLDFCENCFSFRHTVMDCDQPARCFVCRGEHVGICPLEGMPGQGLCCSCTGMASRGHMTFSSVCPEFVKYVSKAAARYRLDGGWCLVPKDPQDF